MMRLTPYVTAIALAALVAGPAVAQVSVPPVPDVAEVVDLSDLPPLLDPADPVLDVVNGVVTGIAAQVDDLLADVPLVNLISLQGDDAIDSAIAFSQATFDSSDTAILARDDVFADSLTTGALQGIFDAPMLLTASGDLDSRTARELVRLGVDSLFILGADDAISPLVAQKLTIAGLDVTRLGGASRVETAVEAAETAAPTATTAVLTRAYAADGDDSQAYADLLAVSPWAAENDWPVLLTQTGSLSDPVRAHLADSDITEVVIIGGENAVSAAAEASVQSLGITTRRVSGSNRYATAVAIAGERGFATSADTDRLILAEGTSSRDDVWAPGFAGAAHGAQHQAPILLTAGDQLPPETLAFITDGLVDNVTDGGPAVVCASFVSPIACQAAGLLMIGDLAAGLDLLGLGLGDLTNLDTVLQLIESVTGIAVADVLGLVEEVLEDPLGTVGEVVDGVTGTVSDATGGATDPVVDVADDVVDAVGGAVPGGGVPAVPPVPPVAGAVGGLVGG